MNKPAYGISATILPESRPWTACNNKITILEAGAVLIAAFIMFWIGARFIVLRLNIPVWDPYVAILAAGALTYAFRIQTGCTFTAPSIASRCLALCSIPIIFVFITFWPGYTLPAHDPIAVPTLANVVISGHLGMSRRLLKM